MIFICFSWFFLVEKCIFPLISYFFTLFLMNLLARFLCPHTCSFFVTFSCPETYTFYVFVLKVGHDFRVLKHVLLSRSFHVKIRARFSCPETCIFFFLCDAFVSKLGHNFYIGTFFVCSKLYWDIMVKGNHLTHKEIQQIGTNTSILLMILCMPFCR